LIGRRVDVQVEPEAQAEEDAALQHAGGAARIAERAEHHRVERPDLVHRLVGDELAGLEVVVRAERVVDELELEPVLDLLEDLDGFHGHFGPDAVSALDADLVGFHRADSLLSPSPQSQSD
jgi:hypothetical protein